MDFKFDYEAAIQQLKDMTMIRAVASFMPDEKTRDMATNCMAVFVKHGIPAEVGLNILMDLSKVLTDKEDK